MDEGFSSIGGPSPEDDRRGRRRRDKQKASGGRYGGGAQSNEEEMKQLVEHEPTNPLSSAARAQAEKASSYQGSNAYTGTNDLASDLVAYDSVPQPTITAPTPSQSVDEHAMGSHWHEQRNGSGAPSHTGVSSSSTQPPKYDEYSQDSSVDSTSRKQSVMSTASGTGHLALSMNVPELPPQVPTVGGVSPGVHAHPHHHPQAVVSQQQQHDSDSANQTASSTTTAVPITAAADGSDGSNGTSIKMQVVSAGGTVATGPTIPIPQGDIEAKPAETSNPSVSQDNPFAATTTSAATDSVTTPPLSERIISCISRFANDQGMLEVHTLKRAMHSAKLTTTQKLAVLPSTYNSQKLLSKQACIRSLQKSMVLTPAAVEDIVSKIDAVPDAVVGKVPDSGGVLSTIEDRLRNIISDTRARLADNEFKRVWDSVHLFTIFYFYAVSLVKNIMDWEFDYDLEEGAGSSWIFITFMIVTLFWILDLVATTQMFTIDSDGRLVKKVREIVAARRWVIFIDVIGILPIDFILQANDKFIPFLVFRLLKVVKLMRVTFLYEIVNRDIITPSTVTFFFQYKPIVTGIFWLCSFIHACAVAHNLIDQYEIRPRKYPAYGFSLVAVCIMLSGSNATVEVWTTADKLLCIPLAVLSLFGQGVLVGKLTALVFRNSVSAENYQLMRDTLGIVRHYKVPNSIQREVLSYQMHALNDDVARHMRNLETLPQQMQHEIMLYIKIDAVSKVKMFANANDKCKMVLAGTLKRVVVEPEVEVVRFGDVGEQMFMVAHGYADVILGTGKIVTTFTRGDCFGEMALVQKSCTRTATVRALTYCDMWTLDKKSFLQALATFPEFQVQVEDELKKRNANIDELKEAVAAIQHKMHMLPEDEGGATPAAAVTGPGSPAAGTTGKSVVFAEDDKDDFKPDIAADVHEADVAISRGLIRTESNQALSAVTSGRLGSQQHTSRNSLFGHTQPGMGVRRQSMRVSLFGDGTNMVEQGGNNAPLSPLSSGKSIAQHGSMAGGGFANTPQTSTQGVQDFKMKMFKRGGTSELETLERELLAIKKNLIETKRKSSAVERQLQDIPSQQHQHHPEMHSGGGSTHGTQAPQEISVSQGTAGSVGGAPTSTD